ncbi:MAG: hypothetical protein PVI28_19930, partial [Gammaproteobacteria bacterium]
LRFLLALGFLLRSLLGFLRGLLLRFLLRLGFLLRSLLGFLRGLLLRLLLALDGFLLSLLLLLHRLLLGSHGLLLALDGFLLGALLRLNDLLLSLHGLLLGALHRLLLSPLLCLKSLLACFLFGLHGLPVRFHLLRGHGRRGRGRPIRRTRGRFGGGALGKAEG